MNFRHTVPCTRLAVPPEADGFGNTFGVDRSAVTFEAVFVPPTTDAGSRIVDGVLRATTVTMPTLYALGSPDVRSGDPIEVDGVGGWRVDGDPADFVSPFTGREAPLVITLRRTDG